MKKFLLASVLCLLSVSFMNTNAKNASRTTEEEVKYTYVITDCGTVHKVDNNLTGEELATAVDYYSELDCPDMVN